MSAARLKHAFRYYSGPTLFLTVVCMTLGSLLLAVGATMGGVFILAGLTALLVFVVIGAREPLVEGR